MRADAALITADEIEVYPVLLGAGQASGLPLRSGLQSRISSKLVAFATQARMASIRASRRCLNVAKSRVPSAAGGSAIAGAINSALAVAASRRRRMILMQAGVSHLLSYLAATPKPHLGQVNLLHTGQ